MIQEDPLAAKTEDGNPLAMPNAYSPRWFARQPRGETPRMQLVFERPVESAG